MSRNIFDPTNGDMKKKGWVFGQAPSQDPSEQAAPPDNTTPPQPKTYPDPDRIPFDPEHADISQIEDL